MTLKQEKFIEVYLSNGGNASAAYRTSYNSNKMKPNVINNKASELLKKDEVRVRIDELRLQINNESIASIEEVQCFYSNVLRDTNEELRERLKASELLMRSKGGFTEKIEHIGIDTIINPFVKSTHDS